MRTTLDIDPDILLAAKELARRRGSSIGTVLSELAREALSQHAGRAERNGVPLFPLRDDGAVVTLELVNDLRDETS